MKRSLQEGLFKSEHSSCRAAGLCVTEATKTFAVSRSQGQAWQQLRTHPIGTSRTLRAWRA